MEKLTKWLGLTDQQAKILEIIYRIESAKILPTPKLIGKKYAELCGRSIQRPNLFNQLKLLQERRIVAKCDGSYSIDLHGIKDVILQNKRRLLEQFKLLDGAPQYIESQFEALSFKPSPPAIKYYYRTELYAELAQLMRESTGFYITTPFPSIFLTHPLEKGAGRADYRRALEDAMITGEQICYITSFDLAFPVRHALALYQKPELAYKECQSILNGIEILIQRYKNLKIRHSMQPFSFSNIILLEGHHAKALTFFIRDQLIREISAGILIKSPEIYDEYKKVFLYEFERAMPINRKFIQKLRRQLELGWPTIVKTETPKLRYLRRFLSAM